MSALRYREKVLAHAELQLASQGRMSPGERLALYKRFFKIENHRLRLKHYAGGGGREIAVQRAELLDVVIRHLYTTALEDLEGHNVKKPFAGLAIVATGGYGRGELNPFSDVDVMFLHAASRMDPKAAQVIEAILYTLWDVGLKVGHVSRSLAGATKQANTDMLSKTALIEARLLAGDEKLFRRFRSDFEKRCIAGLEKEYIADRVKNQAERHQKFGSTVYMQEPNIKNGCGSLRDYQNLLWISFVTRRVSSTSGLVTLKLLPESERRRLDAAYDFLLKVRTELHYLNNRGTDVLSHVYQLQVATKLGYPQKDPLRRIEEFMRDYYRHARVIFQITNTLAGKLCMSKEESARFGLIRFLMRKKKQEHFDGFYVAQGLLFPETREIFKDDPYRMVRAFQHAQQRQVAFSPELSALIRRRLPVIDRTYCYARSGRETFMAIMSRKGEVGHALRLMHECDFLGRYIPEFGAVTCLVQHEFFHRYTVDEHTLVCIEKLDALVDTDHPRLRGYQELFRRLEDPFVLYLALLLHDVGKAANATDHAEAGAILANRVAARLQLSRERRKVLILLVDHHLLISSTAQRRNLEDPATIEEFAGIIRSQSNLDALMLLTLVDGMGVGDDLWSDWKESLVWHLYESTSHYFADSKAYFRQRTLERAETKEAVLKKLPADYHDEVEAHFLYMPHSYFQTYNAPAIISHLRLFRKFFETQVFGDEPGLKPTTRWLPHPERGHTELRVITWDRQQLMIKIAGAIAAGGLNILSADIFTRGDSLVLDVFRVCGSNLQPVVQNDEMALVERTLTAALAEDTFDFAPLLEEAARLRPPPAIPAGLAFPTRIAINNDAHSVYTLLDIQMPDRPGLLYDLLRALAEVGVSIALARIATEKGAAIDSFYITGPDGRKLANDSDIDQLQDRLRKIEMDQEAPVYRPR